MGNDVRGGGDLVLAPGEYAFVLDSTKGQVSTIVGPNKVSLSNTDQPLVECAGNCPRQIAAPPGFF